MEIDIFYKVYVLFAPGRATGMFLKLHIFDYTVFIQYCTILCSQEIAVFYTK